MKQKPFGIGVDELFRKMLAETKPSHGFATRKKNESLADWQARLRKKFLEMLVIEGKPRPAPAIRFVEEVPCEGYLRKRGYMIAEDGLSIPFYLLEPTPKPKGPLPLCLCIHGHGPGKSISVGIAETDAAREQIADSGETHALQAVQRGYIAIAPDSRSFGELMLEEEYRKNGYSSCFQMAMRSIHMGRPLNGQRISDLMQLIDYAVTRDDVDAKKIVITGNSHGGMLTLYTAALDSRIRAAAPTCYLCTFEACLMGVFHCPCNYVAGLQQVCEMSDLAGLIAPRPLLVAAGTKDPMFPIDGVRQAVTETRAIYTAAKAGNELEYFEGPGGHKYYNHRIWSFFAEKLA